MRGVGPPTAMLMQQQQPPVARTARAVEQPPRNFILPSNPAEGSDSVRLAGKKAPPPLEKATVQIIMPAEEEEEEVPFAETQALGTLTAPQLEKLVRQVLALIHSAVGSQVYHLHQPHRVPDPSHHRHPMITTTMSIRVAAGAHRPVAGGAAPSLCNNDDAEVQLRMRRKGCDAELCSPLRSQKTGAPFRRRPQHLVTVGGLTDFLCLHLCAGLALVRSIGSIVGCLKDSGLLPDAFIDTHLCMRPMLLSPSALRAIDAPSSSSGRRDDDDERTVFYVESLANRKRAHLMLLPDLSLMMRAPETLVGASRATGAEVAPAWTRVYPPRHPSVKEAGKEEALYQEDAAEYLEHHFEARKEEEDATPMWHPDTLAAIRAILSPVCG